MAQSEVLRSGSQVLKGGIETVGGQLVNVKDNLMSAVQNMACTTGSTKQDVEVNLAAPSFSENVFAPAPEVYFRSEQPSGEFY